MSYHIRLSKAWVCIEYGGGVFTSSSGAVTGVSPLLAAILSQCMQVITKCWCGHSKIQVSFFLGHSIVDLLVICTLIEGETLNKKDQLTNRTLIFSWKMSWYDFNSFSASVTNLSRPAVKLGGGSILFCCSLHHASQLVWCFGASVCQASVYTMANQFLL